MKWSSPNFHFNSDFWKFPRCSLMRFSEHFSTKSIKVGCFLGLFGPFWPKPASLVEFSKNSIYLYSVDVGTFSWTKNRKLYLLVQFWCRSLLLNKKVDGSCAHEYSTVRRFRVLEWNYALLVKSDPVYLLQPGLGDTENPIYLYSFGDGTFWWTILNTKSRLNYE